MHHLSDYDYELPQDLIAAVPAAERDHSRLLRLTREGGELSHHAFSDIPSFLSDADFLVLNNTEVVPARLHGKKESGGKVEILILDYPGGMATLSQSGFFESPCLIKASIPPRKGSLLQFEGPLTAQVLSYEKGIGHLRFESQESMESILSRIGKMPLPPYIKREREASDQGDRISYQTVYAKLKGAVAAPTAGLHFTLPLLDTLEKKGIKAAHITLHVGYGTFLPVRAQDIRDHVIHRERYEISPDAAGKINQAKQEGKRIVAVGTTTVRTIEHAAGPSGEIRSGQGECDLFIYPGYRFKMVEKLITNFHLPQSTLLMLVSAFAGRETILNAYQAAIAHRYRFYSYGDAMLIT